jgi:hypothetical protein
MKTLKSKAVTPYNPHPVWCTHCCVRIAPYDLRTVVKGKDYHRDCYAKISHIHGKNKN